MLVCHGNQCALTATARYANISVKPLVIAANEILLREDLDVLEETGLTSCSPTWVFRDDPPRLAVRSRASHVTITKIPPHASTKPGTRRHMRVSITESNLKVNPLPKSGQAGRENPPVAGLATSHYGPAMARTPHQILGDYGEVIVGRLPCPKCKRDRTSVGCRLTSVVPISSATSVATWPRSRQLSKRVWILHRGR